MFFFVGLKVGGGNFFGLVTKEIKFASEGLLSGGDGGLFLPESKERAAAFTESPSEFLIAGKAIEEAGLLFPGKEALMIVGPVQIDEENAEPSEESKGTGRSIGKLASGAGGGQSALEEELTVIAGFRAMGVEECRNGGFGHPGKGRLDRAGISARADERFIRPLTEQQRDSTKDDGFTGSGLSGDSGKPGVEVPSEILDESKISNSQGSERCGHGRTMAKDLRCGSWKSRF